jgi:hypothetical protein
MTTTDESYVLDMGTLGVHPVPASALASNKSPAGVRPLSNEVGKGNAFMSISPEVANQSTSPAASILTAGWTLGESVQILFNGSLVATFAASATTGRLLVSLNTGAGFGYITVEEVGVTSGRRAGGVLQVDSTGPYLPGLAVGPHAVNTSASGTIGLFGRGFPASSTVTIYRNGVSLGSVTSSATGTINVSLTPGNNGNTSAVYSADAAATAMAGQSIEERSDAGTPPTGDQNTARAFVDRALVNSVIATAYTLVGEGFQPGENVNVTGSATTTLIADINGAVSTLVTSGPGFATYSFVLTGATSARVARASVLGNANATNIRGIIVAPGLATPGSIVTACVDRLPATTLGTYYLDGVAQGTTTTDASGNATFPITAPLMQFTHEVGFVPTTGGAQAAVLLVLGIPTASDSSVVGRITDEHGLPVEGAVVQMTGSQDRKFITDANGYYRFDNVKTSGFYTVTPSRVNYTFSPSSQSFSQLGETTQAVFNGTASGQTENPLDTPEYFVRQQYVDFLGREPDEAGFNFWSDQILGCGTDTNCIDRKRENVSAAYFLSIEFQQTGGLVDGLYRASYGVRPSFDQFMPDTRAVGFGVVVGDEGWQAKVAANKKAFVNAFVNRAAFHAAYDGMDNSSFVSKLIDHTGISFTAAERDAFTNALASGTMTRAEVLRSIAEDTRFVNAKFNQVFVMMEYFGYLRRETDDSGYNFWLSKLNQFNGNFEQAEMVKSFIVSGEYRGRFAR